ncbi:MAG: isoprenylcysteine carboxylmethyltransferase family protein [Candidatus Nitronauta litoralis]|uniref:Isoprenylcysteine carboxylmethyltransferase family protein n=1 Tax=Candidatus Nitronauta litoralis TaxID=2705533 RepID=A0A7T0BVJ3_9BACT|nr:MAG: isoprenylcysteine carboxylmethyltransferase family protein [Candidatus Nitronauta litoralis]
MKELALNILVPSLYPLGLAVLWLGPLHFGFGHDAIVIVGLVSGLSGIIIWITSMLHLGKSFAVLPGSNQLVKRGIYSRLRHPIYLGINMTFLGMTLCAGSSWGLAYVVGIILPLNFIRARLEDRALETRFGDSYNEWKKTTWF